MRRAARLRALVLTMGVCALGLSAAPSTAPAAPPQWARSTSPHFEIYVSSQPTRAAEIAAVMERLRSFMTTYLELPVDSAQPLRVIVLSGEKEFAPYRVNESGSAFFEVSHNRRYIVLREYNADAAHVIAHEYAHAALGEKGADLPPWLGEGLAEFFSSLSLQTDAAVIGAAPTGRRETLGAQGLMALPRVFGVTRASAEYNTQQHASLFYAESWALTHMLMMDPKYRDHAQDFIGLVRGGENAGAALQRVFQQSVADAERDLRRYVLKDFYGTVKVPYHAASVARGEAPTPVAPLDAQLLLADVLAGQDAHVAEARRALDALAADAPTNVGVLETRAYLEARVSPETADPFIAKAVEAGSTDGRLVSEYADRLASGDPARAAALYTRAVTLAPTDARVRIRAAMHSIRRQLPDEAAATIATIARVPLEDRFEYFQVVANIKNMSGDFDEATGAAAEVLAAAQTPAQTTFAEQFIKAVGGPADMSRLVTGRVRNMACEGAHPILEIDSPDGLVRLEIDAPDAIVVTGAPAGATTSARLECGAQDRPVRAGYADAAPTPGTQGRLRYLNFRQK